MSLYYCQLLLLNQPGIDMYAKDDRGNTALDAARINEKQDAVKTLEELVDP